MKSDMRSDSKSKKIIITIIISVAVVICAIVVVVSCFIYNNSISNSTNSQSVAEKIDTSNNNIVDASTNQVIASNIADYTSSLPGVTVQDCKAYYSKEASEYSSNPSTKSTSSNNISNDNASNGYSNSNINSSTSNSNSSGSNSNNSTSSMETVSDPVNIILDLRLTPFSTENRLIRQELESNANNLAVSIAAEKPTIKIATFNWTVDNMEGATASFTFERQGNNMSLQEFTMSEGLN